MKMYGGTKRLTSPTSRLRPEEQKEVDEAFAVAEPKMRNFVQARQPVKARNLSRGFYPFSPHSKRGAFKEKEKGKPRAHPR